MSVVVSYKKQAVLGLLLLATLLATIEGILQVYEIVFPPNCSLLESDSYKDLTRLGKMQICHDLQYLLYKDSSILLLEKNQHSKTINVNMDGFRGKEISVEKSHGVFRIFMVGGSTTFGAGSTSDQTTIPAFLQEEFFTHNMTNVEVINAGMPWADSSREAYLIKKTLLKYDPDLFIIYDGWNDAVHRRLVDPVDRESDTFDFLKFKNFPYYRTPFYIYKILHPTTSEFAIGPGDSEKPSNADDTVLISKWEQRWKEICTMGQKNNFKTIIVIQPILGSGNKPLTEFEKKTGISDATKTIDSMANSLKDLNGYCSETADFRNSFDGITNPIFIDNGHTNDLGNKIIAQRMFQVSESLITSSN